MKVILIEDIDRMGHAGDIVTVKDGYARNYLIPKGKAKPATPENMRIVEALKKKAAEAEEKKREEAQAFAGRISTLSLTISAKAAGEEEKLYGSVTSEMIADSLKISEGITIDKKDIILDEPIKKLGVYQVTVKVHPDVRANLRLWIVKE